ncbi:MAG: Dabb family protein [Lachnospiraceae bacterium]
MVKHVILWTLKNEYSKEEKKQSRQKSKLVLRDLQVRLGLLEIHVNINGLESSNADLMLDSIFTDEAALKGYPYTGHVAVANGKVRHTLQSVPV